MMSNRELPIAVSLWIAGYTYEKISDKTGMSTGAISNLINEWKKKIPGLEELHDISRTLKKRGAGLLEVLRGAKILDLVNDLGVSLEEIPQCLELFHAVEGRPPEIAAAGLHLLELEKKTGFSFPDLIEEYLKKVEKLAKTEKSLKALKAKKKAVRDNLSDLKKLEELDEKFRELGLTPKKVEKLMASALSMEELGFTPKIAEVLASELKEVGLEPRKAAREIARLVKKHRGLETAVSKLSRTAGQIKTQITGLQDEVDDLKKQREIIQKSINNRQKAGENLEAWYKRRNVDLEEEYSDKHGSLEKAYSEKRRSLEKEYDLKERSLKLEISELEEKEDEVQKEYNLLIKKRDQLADIILFSVYTLNFLTDRDKVPTEFFDNLMQMLKSTVEMQMKGLTTLADMDEKKARSIILKVLTDHIETDIVPKRIYNELKEEYEGKIMELEGEVQRLEGELEVLFAEKETLEESLTGPSEPRNSTPPTGHLKLIKSDYPSRA